MSRALLVQMTWIYDIATKTWTQSGSKVYNDRSDEESWVRRPTGA